MKSSEVTKSTFVMLINLFIFPVTSSPIPSLRSDQVDIANPTEDRNNYATTIAASHQSGAPDQAETPPGIFL